MTTALERDWGGEHEWDPVVLRLVTGLSSVLTPYKRDRRVLHTVPRWAMTIATRLLSNGFSVPMVELVLLWCASAEPAGAARVYERAASVVALLDLDDSAAGPGMWRVPVRAMLGLDLETWKKPNFTRDEKAALRARWAP